MSDNDHIDAQWLHAAPPPSRRRGRGCALSLLVLILVLAGVLFYPRLQAWFTPVPAVQIQVESSVLPDTAPNCTANPRTAAVLRLAMRDQTDAAVYDCDAATLEACMAELLDDPELWVRSYQYTVHGGLNAHITVTFDWVYPDGIPARVITGTSRSADGTADSHAWVAAELDGAVYYFDPTWDLQDDESEAALPGYLSHTWFALTAERMAVRHTADDPTLWPDSRANADNYYVRSGYTAAEATVAAAAAAVRSQWDDGRAVLEFRCETPEVYAGMQSLLFERDRLWDVYRALGSYVSSSGYQCADDQQIIRLIPAR